MQSLDILHPSTSLEWEQWPSLSVGMYGVTIMCHNGILYVEGGWTNSDRRADARLYSFKPASDKNWTASSP